jgi:hypothetical protein
VHCGLRVGNWLLKAVNISELKSANGLVLAVQWDGLQHSVGVWSRDGKVQHGDSQRTSETV